MKNLRWGVLSTAKIALNKVIPAMQKSKYCEIIAIASRNIEKAKAESIRLKIPKAFGSPLPRQYTSLIFHHSHLAPQSHGR